MTAKIIAICGEKRSGKDVLANYIAHKYGYTKLAFADPLKNIVKLIFDFNDIQVGIDEINCNGTEKDTIDERWGISPRQALQFFGTEIFQNNIQQLIPNINKDFFANSLINKIKDNHTYVISDIRFLHEYEKLKNYDLTIIRISRPTNFFNTDNHLSEQEFKKLPFDFEIVNDTTIQKYFHKYDLFHLRVLKTKYK
jgi:dephospho-CoA kinase